MSLPHLAPLLVFAVGGVVVSGQTCPGTVDVLGLGQVAVIPTGWHMSAAAVEVVDGATVVPHMGGRAYFAEECSAGTYDHNQYLALNLLGKTLRYTTDMSGSGCGCNAALYLVSMRQNTDPSTCHDYYCDANSVCGVACAEIDIQEANQHAWHSTLHSSHDHSGVGVGYGGGDGWNGPRDFTAQQYGPGAECIDTSRPFEVAVSFPVDMEGTLLAMEVTLSQEGHSCPLDMKLNAYAGMAELSAALAAGMTPVISYWSDDAMLWMDGKGADGQGPCASDDAAACTDSVKFYGFSVAGIGAPEPAQQVQTPAHTFPTHTFPTHTFPSSRAGESSHGSGASPLCPGKFDVRGYGSMSLVGAKLNVPGEPAGHIEVREKTTIVPHMKGRAYFGETCKPGSYSNEQYVGLKLLGKTLRYTTDMSGAGCGCNAALYLVSMRQNERPSQCGDHYCDANNVCGESCAEIDIQEANQRAWHSTLHSAQDHGGIGAGYGGGNGWNGPRDFNAQQYGPGAECIDTNRPFQVAVSFPLNDRHTLEAMEVTLTQVGSACPLRMRISDYAGMAELSRALALGMTPVVSYWSADDMTWMDGQGADGLGPCASDNAALCPDSVKFYNFSIEEAGKASSGVIDTSSHTSSMEVLPKSRDGAACPGAFNMSGYGHVSLVPTGWHANGAAVEVIGSNTLVPHMGSRSYFASRCTPGTYDNKQYLALNLLGKTLQYTVDLSGAGCGCNAALYLVSMQQNTKPSTCHDYYCDANSVCGVACAEIDIQEANQYAWHSTLHTSHDHAGKGAGFGGGDGWTGPRDFTSEQFSPGGSCIDTSKPFRVAASFPTDASGALKAMDVILSQDGRSCPLSARVGDYSGMARLSEALSAGMTPVMSYWKSNDMLWMDGVGSDGAGPCVRDDAASCAESVRLYDFAISNIGGGVAAASNEARDGGKDGAAALPAHGAGGAQSTCAGVGEDCRSSQCCGAPRMKCHWENEWWSSCTPHDTLPAGAKGVDSALLGLSEELSMPIGITLPLVGCSAAGENCNATKCCSAPGMQCYQKNSAWAACKTECTAGVDASEGPGHRTPWSCVAIGSRAPSSTGRSHGADAVKGIQIPSKTAGIAGAQEAESTSGSSDATWWRLGLASIAVVAIAAAASRKLRASCTSLASWWQKGRHAKAQLQLDKGPSGAAHQLAAPLQESPVRRRRGDGGVTQAPAAAEFSAAHARWPSNASSVASAGLSPMPGTPGRWPLVPKA